MKRCYNGEVARARLTCSECLDDPQTWWLDFLYVPQDHRGQGQGKSLMQRAIRDADRESITLVLEARCCSLPGQGGIPQGGLQAWYAGLGFVLMGPGEIGPRMVRAPQ